ncbi:hypothetical protein BDU57DRAFT_447687 [Ampelomyces quisqualis]|uniref:Uncharacterized protein n=1 Tax=Ampelomyces quisqualis TaxID=50730 RepID=A0A6A5QNS1_AMPQU|nr:hypothetical protein BDU57DRAFT_447687 [Ampelomyces quisqualis]
MAAPGPDASLDDKIKWIQESYKDLSKQHNFAASTLEQDVAKVELADKDEELSFAEQTRRDFLPIKMPVHPAEENATGTKESSDSNASTHKLQYVDEVNEATSGGGAHAAAHKANPGPVHADNLPIPASKEELKKRAEELNK